MILSKKFCWFVYLISEDTVNLPKFFMYKCIQHFHWLNWSIFKGVVHEIIIFYPRSLEQLCNFQWNDQRYWHKGIKKKKISEIIQNPLDPIAVDSIITEPVKITIKRICVSLEQKSKIMRKQIEIKIINQMIKPR